MLPPLLLGCQILTNVATMLPQYFTLCWDSGYEQVRHKSRGDHEVDNVPRGGGGGGLGPNNLGLVGGEKKNPKIFVSNF